MEMRFDHNQWLLPPAETQGSNGLHRPLDWHVLSARLAAAHACRRALAEEDGDWAAPMGSFDPIAARYLIDYAASAPPDWGFDAIAADSSFAAVNPIALGVRKSMRGNESGVAGPSHPAIEG